MEPKLQIIIKIDGVEYEQKLSDATIENLFDDNAAMSILETTNPDMYAMQFLHMFNRRGYVLSKLKKELEKY